MSRSLRAKRILTCVIAVIVSIGSKLYPRRFGRTVKTGDSTKEKRGIVLENLSTFCKNTTLHGFSYIGDENLSIFERTFFGIAFVIAFGFSISFIHNVYSKWKSTPMIISLSPLPIYIENIPFPAVTICNMNQAMASKVSTIKKNSIEDTILQIQCFKEVDQNSENYNYTGDWNLFLDFQEKYTQSCESLLKYCKFGQTILKCNEVFETTLTDEGTCCTFNALHESFMYKSIKKNESAKVYKDIPVQWSPEKDYPSHLPDHFYPRTPKGIGSSLGLTVILDAQVNEYYCSTSSGSGFKVLLHNPTETPLVSDTGFLLEPGYENRVVISPTKYDASEALRDISKYDRQCVFENEIELDYYRTYSRSNCKMEYEAHLIARKCGCLLHYMPRLVDNLPICRPNNINCQRRALYISHLDKSRKRNNFSSLCMPECFELSYSQTVFSSPINNSGFYVKNRFIQNVPFNYLRDNIAIAHIYFREGAFRSNRKEQFIGLTEFLANTGGLMGLFIGFSFISIVEIIYYAALRPLVMKMKMIRENRNKPNCFVLPNKNTSGNVGNLWQMKKNKTKMNTFKFRF